MMNMTIGIIFAIVVTLLTAVDDLTPRKTNHVMSHKRIEAARTDHQVVPDPKKLKMLNEPSAEKITTR